MLDIRLSDTILKTTQIPRPIDFFLVTLVKKDFIRRIRFKSENGILFELRPRQSY